MNVYYCNGKHGICMKEGVAPCNSCEFQDGTGGECIDFDNPYWERISLLAAQQRVKGMSKYGVGLENNPAAISERINHLQEELIDGLMYCEWIKDHLKELEG